MCNLTRSRCAAPRPSLACCLVAALAALVAATAPARGQLYAIAPFAAAQLYTIDPLSGAAQLVGPITDPQLEFAGIEFDSTGRLLGIDSFRLGGGATRKLWQIDPSSGTVNPQIDLHRTDIFFEGGFAVDPATDAAYLVEEADLYRLDVFTGSLTHLGQLSFSGSTLSTYTNIDGLTFRGGELYGIVTIQSNGLDGHLIKIDPDTRSVTDVGFTGLEPSSPAGLAHDLAADTFYLAATGLPGLYRLDPKTAVASLVGEHGLPEISGLAYLPEPSAAAASGALMTLCLLLRRRLSGGTLA